MTNQIGTIIVDGVRLWATEEGELFTVDGKGKRKFLKQYAQKTSSEDNPYMICFIKRKKYYVHRLVLGAFSGGLMPDKLEVDHINGLRSDNRCGSGANGNLRWVTPSENCKNRHGNMLCYMPDCRDYLVDGEPVESWMKLAESMGVPYINLKQWVEVHRSSLPGRIYHNHKFEARIVTPEERLREEVKAAIKDAKSRRKSKKNTNK